MSKRCCANNCFNSLLSNKRVEYFGIPRHEGFAKAWCIAAGREDLLEKPLNNIIKYHICSEHFTDDCFKDPKERKMLKKTSRPVNVPIPTVFKNNIDQFLHKSYDNDNCYNNKSKILNLNACQTLSSQLPTFDGDPSSVNTIQIVDDDDECMYLGRSQTYEIGGIETCCTTENPIQIYRSNDVEFIMEEERLDEDATQNQLSRPILKSTALYDNTEEYDYHNVCRLCAEPMPPEENLFNLFTTHTNHLLEYINKVLPKPIYRDDGLPQRVCLSCLNKMEMCSQTLSFFSSAQDKFQQ